MAQYSIKDLEQLSGIKAHTIRIWEQRYSLLEPKRTSTNIRYYTDEDVKKILQVSLLKQGGLKISKIAELKDDEIGEKVVSLKENPKDVHPIIEDLTVCMIDYNEEKFEKTLNHSIEIFGFDKTFKDVIYPFFEKIGVLWMNKVITPAQEHFISNLIRQKLITAIDELSGEQFDHSNTCLVFLHEEEMHELGILYYTYHLKLKGVKVVYLGQMVPYEDLQSVFKQQKIQHILTSFVKQMPKNWVNKFVDRLANDFPDTRILVSGIQAKDVATDFENVVVIKDLENLIEAFES